MQYQLKDKDPTTLLIAQEMTVKIDQNMQSSVKSNSHGYTRVLIPPKQQEIRAKDSTNHMQETSDKKMKEMNDRMEALQANYVNQLKDMQNRVINIERARTSQNNFPPKEIGFRRKPRKIKAPLIN